jgi:hypothetical protein
MRLDEEHSYENGELAGYYCERCDRREFEPANIEVVPAEDYERVREERDDQSRRAGQAERLRRLAEKQQRKAQARLTQLLEAVEVEEKRMRDNSAHDRQAAEQTAGDEVARRWNLRGFASCQEEQADRLAQIREQSGESR